MSSPAISRLQAIVIVFLGLFLSVAALWYLSAVLQPLFVAAFISYLAISFRNWLVRWHLPPGFASALVPVCFLLGVMALFWMTLSSLQILKGHLTLYQEQIDIIVETLFNLTKHFPVSAQTHIEKMLTEYRLPVSVASLLAGLSLFAAFFGTAFAVALYMVFLSIESKTLPLRIEQAFGQQKGKALGSLMRRINEGIVSYIGLKSMMSLVTSLFCAFFMILFDVDVWWFWAFLIYLGNFVPYIGSTLASVLPVIICFLGTGSVSRALGLAACLFIAQNIVDNILEPRAAGKQLNLSPLVVIVSLAFWGWLWGIVGMILAVPVLVAVKMTLEEIPATRAFGQLLGERAEAASASPAPVQTGQVPMKMTDAVQVIDPAQVIDINGKSK